MKIRAGVVALSCLLVPVASAAQGQVPDAGMFAVGADFGYFFASDDALDPGPTLAGLVDYYVTPRLGIRGTLGWASNDFTNFSDAQVRQVRLLGTVLYNWEFGKVHPYAGAGVGMYMVKGKIAGVSGDSDTRGGFHLGGGIEYFTSRTLVIKGEVLYHGVSGDEQIDASGTALTVGVKKYF